MKKVQYFEDSFYFFNQGFLDFYLLLELFFLIFMLISVEGFIDFFM